MFAENWGNTQAIRFQGVYQDRLDSLILCSEFMPSPVWKVITKLDVLPKVKIFAWRLGREGLLTESWICTVGLDTRLRPFCQSSIETTLHAFRKCGDSREALLMADIAPSLITSFVSGMLPWLEETAAQLSRPAFDSLLKNDYLSASYSTGRSATTTTLGLVAWSPPPLGTVTINTDGSFTADSGYLAGLTKVVFAKQATLLARLQLALEYGWPSVLLETDSTQTVNRLCRSSSSDMSIYGLSLESIRAFFSTHPHIRLRFIPRSANRVALTLAS
ncbi:hypothetical protein V6N12_009684 [Hibiscus sabdariffa]|uniref:RNase H type-1 domain-containing protein n=1 Tax=Hibiscus sabdariffa TaxID=183260 RepID=A0ABR2BUL3_9ROSI